MSEKLCLRWDDFQENIKSAFGHLREESDFADVTLACEDGQQVEAHKVILAASSPFFQKLLGRFKHPHPLIYMRGVKSDDLLAILDFLYRGEANVFQENLDSFLAIAEELHLKGLMGKTDGKVQDFEEDENPQTVSPAINTDKNMTNNSLKIPRRQKRKNRALAIPNNFFADLVELEEKVKSMMEKSENRVDSGVKFADICKVCGKEGDGNNIKSHIVANHLGRVIIPCSICGKTFRSINGLIIIMGFSGP